MDEADVRASVEQIIRKMFPSFKKLLLDETVAKEVPGWDSVSHFDLILRIEDKFGIEVDSTESYSLENIGELMELVLKTLRSQR